MCLIFLTFVSVLLWNHSLDVIAVLPYISVLGAPVWLIQVRKAPFKAGLRSASNRQQPADRQ